jgi:DegV family protein with EDD domain
MILSMKESEISMPDRKIAIITDSTCDLPDALLQEYSIRFVPLRIVYGALEYRDRIDITAQQVIERFAEEVPKTTLPLAQDVTDVWDSLAADGYTDAVYLSISGGLSGSYNLIRLLAQQYTDMNIEVIDTCTVSMPLGFLVLEAAREAARTGDTKAVIEKVQQIRARMDALFVIKNLDFLVRGGRLGKVEGAMGNLLDIKPIITFGTDGICHTITKARGFKNAVHKMLLMIKNKYSGKQINVSIVHAGASEDAYSLLDEVKRFSTICQSSVEHLCPALSIYSGPGLVGVVAYEVEGD